MQFFRRLSHRIHTLPTDYYRTKGADPANPRDDLGPLVNPKELVVNSDQGSLNLIHLHKVTYAAKGAKDIPILWMDDKSAVTGVLGSAANGDLLPWQVSFRRRLQWRLSSNIFLPDCVHWPH